MLGLVACVALNIWLFRVHVLAGIIGLNVTKHVVTAYLCQVIGIDKRRKLAGVNRTASVPAPGLPCG